MKEKESAQKSKQEERKTAQQSWHVYLLKSEKTGEFYCGVTTDLNRRLREHNGDNRKGAKWTHGRRPLVLVWSETHNSKSLALKREAVIKSMSRATKEAHYTQHNSTNY